MLLSARSDKSAAGVIMRQGADPRQEQEQELHQHLAIMHPSLTCALAIAPKL